MAINFKLVSEFQTLHRRDFPITTSAILNPNNVRPLIDGEWLELGAAAYEMDRTRDNVDGGDISLVPSYVYFAEQGRYETQAIGKGPFLYMGEYEADTLVFRAAPAIAYVVGGPLMVMDTVIAGSAVVRRGLSSEATGYTVGRITRLAANNNNFMRFRSVNG
jgi:hypothetical protein